MFFYPLFARFPRNNMTVPPWLSSNSFAAFDGWLPPLCWRPQPSLTGTLASHFTCAPPQEISNLGRPVKMAPVLQPGSNPRIPAPAAWFKQRVRVAAAKIEKQGYSYDELDLCLTAGTSTGRLSHSDSVLAPLRLNTTLGMCSRNVPHAAHNS